MACVVPARTDGQINVFSQPRLCEGWVGGFEKIKDYRNREREGGRKRGRGREGRRGERDIHTLAVYVRKKDLSCGAQFV